MKYLIIPVLALLVACGGATEEPNAALSSADPYVKVNAADFAEMIKTEGTVLIDVRTPQEYAEDGHITGSTNIDLMSDDFVDRVNELDPEKVTYVYCRAGGRSKRAAGIMQTGGIKKVIDLEGGITAWKEAGLAVE